MGWLNDLSTFLSDNDPTSIYLLIEDVEQMSCSLKRTAVDGFFKHLELGQMNPYSVNNIGNILISNLFGTYAHSIFGYCI